MTSVSNASDTGAILFGALRCRLDLTVWSVAVLFVELVDAT